ncbi:MAG TPA: ThiF family adenylyltransferase [Candidatus Paceibacterota bacterium]|nr:ThiF family adenylyltransferase [Candidatus Paceibacterota bacterium]
MDLTHVVIVGIGGVGTHLSWPICQYLAYKSPKTRLTLIDGDNFEPRNAERQVFTELGNKAEVTATRLGSNFSELTIEAKPHFLTEDNAFVFIREGALVFCCVDNHASRKLLSDHCSTLRDVVLISGGNDYDDGNVQVYVRCNGEDVTSPLTYLHDEIARPQDRNPAELSCEERAATGTPQLVFANFTVASAMANAFWVVTEHGVVYNELYFDLKSGAQRPVLRKKEQK